MFRNTGNLLPHTPASDPSSKHTGAAVGGFFGLLALIALAAVIFMMISRRRRGQQADESFQGLGESARTGSTDQEKSKMTEAKSGTQEGLAIHTNYHGSSKALDEPMMSPMDPVTRFSQGGFTLLKRLESITDSFNRSVHSASPDGSSSDDEPLETSLTNPSAAELGRHVGLPKSESRMHIGEPAIVSPLLLRTGSDCSSDSWPTGSRLIGDSPDSHRAGLGSAGTGVGTIASGPSETVQLPR